jgi:hypothetical protein
MTDVRIINPIKYAHWDDLLLTHPDTNFFHTTAWATVLSETYGYKPLYFAGIKNNKLTGLIAITEIYSHLTGKRGVSLPFSDFSDIIAPDKKAFDSIKKQVFEYGKNSKWKYVEFRGGNNFLNRYIPFEKTYIHCIDLSKHKKTIYKQFSRSNRRNIRIAIRKKLKVKVERSYNGIKSFYKIHCLNRRYHGIPPQPFLFFKNLFNHTISKNKGVIFTIWHEDTVIASAVVLTFGSTAIYKYSAFERNYWRVKPNNLLMWSVVKWAKKSGYRTLNLGRTELDNLGLLEFKERWNTNRIIYNYYRYNIIESNYIKPRHSQKFFNHLKRYLKYLPSKSFDVAGKILYKHFG